MPRKGRVPEELPALDADEQMCSVCTHIGQMLMEVHEPGCRGTLACSGTKFELRQRPHVGKQCPRCQYAWAERLDPS